MDILRRPWLFIFLFFLPLVSFAVVFEDPDFTQENIERPDGRLWDSIVGLEFTPDGQRAFVWERGGRVWILDEADPVPQPFLDISDEVLGWRDHGMLGFALDPEFISNGHVYLNYGVDRHHLEHCVEPASGVGQSECDAGYDPATTITATRASIGRLTRYTAVKPSGDADYRRATVIDYDSRKVLVGETPQTGFPNLHQSHSSGQIVFGTDGTLLAAFGDAASYSSTDVGSNDETAFVEALADGIITPEEDVGAYRSQMLESLNGKVIRIDPQTGDGVPSNPFYDPAAPRSPESRTWALGLRNPFRMILRPGTGSHLASEGDPGTLFIGDVGWSSWEEFNVIDGPGQNFGWPAYEGLEQTTIQYKYFERAPVHQHASNVLGCDVKFTDLIKQPRAQGTSFPNPCRGGEITEYPVFDHARPTLDWRHGQNLARYPAFGTDGEHVSVTVGQPIPGTSTVVTAGAPFAGNASTVGTWYSGDDFPVQYKDTYFHADYGSDWIKNFVIDEQNRVTEVRPFLSNDRIVFVTTNPVSGHLYYVRWSYQLFKILYAPGGNRPPIAVAGADSTFGPSPLDVNFSADDSTDPEGSPLTARWNFGDGSATVEGTFPSHTFVAPSDDPANYTVTLTVTDEGSPALSDSTDLNISVNNTPPEVAITSPADGTRYPMSGDTLYNLRASISDAEHDASGLTCAWQTVLHHNDHTHEDPIDSRCDTQVQIPPVGCDGETYFFRIHLEVTDDAGLSARDEVTLYPDCEGGSAPVAGDDSAQVLLGDSVDINVLANDSGNLDLDSLAITQAPGLGTAVILAGTGQVRFTPTRVGNDSFGYTVRDTQGRVSNEALVRVTIEEDVASPKVETPVFSPAGGNFPDGVSVTLTSATPDAEIFLTRDGTEPTPASELVSGPVILETGPDVTLRARAYRDGYVASAVASASFRLGGGGVPSAGLIGYWPLDEGGGSRATDQTGNGHHGVVSGAQWASGWTGGGLAFDGLDDVVVVPHDPALAFGAGDSFTLALWVNLAASETGTSGVVTKSAEDGPWYGLWVSSWGKWFFGGPSLFSGGRYSTGWHQLTLVQDGSSGVRRLYVDGVQTGDGLAQAADGPGELWFGGAAGLDEYMAGSLDEIRLYNRALDDSEVLALASNLPGPQPPQANDDAGTLYRGGVLTLDVLANDSDEGQLLPATVEVVSLPGAGTVEGIDATTGRVEYRHDGGSANSDSFQYRVQDDDGLWSSPATVNLTIEDYVPPTVTILAPQEGAVVSGNLVVRWERSGDDTSYDHVHVQLDDNAYVPLHNLSLNQYDFGAVAEGPHRVQVWLVDANHIALTNPEARDEVSFTAEAGAPPKVADPSISPNGGSHVEQVNVVLSTSTADALVHYTTDGQDPDQNDPFYDGSLVLTSSATVKARAYRDGWTPSEVVSTQFDVVPGGGGGLPSAGLLAYWPLDEGSGAEARDQSGNGHHGEIRGAAWSAGWADGGLAFDGLDDVVVVPHDAALAFGAGDSFSLALWVNLSANETGTSGVVTKSAEDGPWYGLWVSSWGKWFFGGPSLFSGGRYTTGWHQLTLVQDGSAGVRRIYVDGVETRQGVAQAANGTGELWFGGAAGLDEYVEGSLDEIRLYGRALSDSEITTLATVPPGPPGPVPPEARDDSGQLSRGGSLAVDVLANDSGNLVASSVEITQAPSHGSISSIDATNGAIRYQHDGGTATADSFGYRVQDDAGLWSSSATVSLTIQPVAPPTVAITSPVEGAVIAGAVMVQWSLSGTLSEHRDTRLQLDSEPAFELGDPDRLSYDFGTLAEGPHQVRIWLLDGAGQVLAGDQVNLSVDLGAPPVVATPTMTPPGGDFSGPVNVVLASSTGGATIHYTTNGAEPTQGDPRYDEPLTFSESTQLRARAFLDGYTPSAIAEASFVVTSAPGSLPTAGLVGYWPLDAGSGNTAQDQTGNGHNGEIRGASWTAGWAGGALEFDGVSSVVVVPHGAALSFEETDSFSLSLWVAPSVNETGTSGIVTKSAEQPPWYGLWVSSWGKWFFGGPRLFGGGLFSPGWHQLILIQDGTAGTRQIYVDGVQTGSGLAQPANGPGDLWFGGTEFLDEFFEGTLDEIRLYDRALTADEIQVLSILPPE